MPTTSTPRAKALMLLAAGLSSSLPAVAESSEFILEEVIVTAQKRAQSLQDVPIAITALSADFIVSNDIRSLEDLSATVPGFVTTNNVNYGAAPLSIRGIGGTNGGGNLFADEPVAVYIDDVYIGRLSASTADLLDIASIEVLRGPQGTLYGRNSTAGAVIVRSTRPSEELEGFIRASVAQNSEYRLQAAIGGPVTDAVGARLAIGYSDRDGYGDNLVSDDSIGGSEDLSIRASVHFDLSDSVSLDLIADYLDQESSPATLAVADLSNPLSASPFVRRSDFDQVIDSRQFEINDANFLESKHAGITALLHWDLETVSIDSVTSYRSYEFNGAQDSDGSALSLFNNNGTSDNYQFSQELRLSSSNDAKLSWVVGAFFFKEENEAFFQIRNVNALFGLGTLAQFEAQQSLQALALFADVNWQINETFSLTLGGRYSHEDKDFENALSVDILNGGTLPPFSPIAPGATLPAGTVFRPRTEFSDDAVFEDFSPRVVVNAQLNDDMLAYVSYSQGFTSGGFNVFGLNGAFEEQSVDAYELGLKSDLFDRRVRLNASAFYYDYSDLQLRLPVPTGGVDIANAAQAQIQGFELEATLLPLQGLRIVANLALLDTEFSEGSIPAVVETGGFPVGAPIPLFDQDISGNELSRAPELQAYLSADYTWSLTANADLTAQLSIRYQDAVYFLETNQTKETFSSQSFSEVDLRIAYYNNVNDIEVALLGSNIFDDRHVSQVSALGSFPNAALNEPAKWSLQVIKKF